MLSSQLMQLIKSLTKHDLREMRKVVRSPYFNQREDVILLFDYIEKNIASQKAEFSKENVFNALFPNKKYDDTYLRQIMSYLYKITQNYLITEGVLQDGIKTKLSLVNTLRTRNSDKVFENILEETIKTIGQNEYKNAKYHYANYQLYLEDYEYKSKKKRSSELNLQKTTEELDFYYMSECLRQACLMYAHDNMSRHDYNQPLLKPIMEHIEHSISSIPISVIVYFYIYKVLTDIENEHYYRELKYIILNKIDLFPENEKRDIHISAINYCIKRLNKGNKLYGFEALDLYRERIKNNVLLDNNLLPYYTYNNILMLALKNEEYAWAEKFLNDFKQYLPEKERENIFEYNLALYYFRVGKYKEAMPLLQKVNLNDVLYNLDARRLLARIYYEQNELNPLMSLIESAKVYLHRQKGIGYHHEMYANYFRYMDKMLKIDMKNPNARKILRGEVEKTQLLAERDWLLQVLS